ncbi:MAG: Na/Pi cotransporter family protein [Litoreibacter sp.]|uniref:Na/Pi cotransporter family protein n=1 Tax=Litoreibacter sp. TaxID=1969459 RepID=UPI00329A35C2
MSESSALILILNVAGAVALLLWAVRLIRTGVERAFDVQLRRWLRHSTKSRLRSAVTGVGSAVLLQSSTAVAMLIAGFVSAGTIKTTAGIAIILGADLGSAIVASILVARWSFVMPLLLVCGVVLFLKGRSGRARQVGRILVGLGLVFLSLEMIRTATAPISEGAQISGALQALASDLPIAFILGGVLAWAMHSSVASILLLVTLAAQGTLPTEAAAVMVLGANVGGALIATTLTFGAPAEVRRVTTSNFIIRGVGAVALAVMVAFAGGLPDYLGASVAGQIIALHVLFNLILCLAGLSFVSLLHKLATAIHPNNVGDQPMRGPVSALDPTAVETPERALGLARREVMRMGETLEAMLRAAGHLFVEWDDAKARTIVENEAYVSKIHHDLKMFLALLAKKSEDDLVEGDAHDLAKIAVGMEAAADTITRSLSKMASKLNKEGLQFSEPGQEEIADFHDRVLGNVQLGLSVLMTSDMNTARTLVSEKDNLRDVEQELQKRHLVRLRDGLPESIETSAIHQETLRGLKQVNTSFSMIGSQLLHRSGDLLSSRLA